MHLGARELERVGDRRHRARGHVAERVLDRVQDGEQGAGQVLQAREGGTYRGLGFGRQGRHRGGRGARVLAHRFGPHCNPVRLIQLGMGRRDWGKLAGLDAARSAA